MDTIKKMLVEISSAFFSVNRFAGKLRSLLCILLVFILWTLNAQILPPPIDLAPKIGDQGSFIGNLLRDIAGSYFHPLTLLLTGLPVFLFFFARNLVARFLSRIANISPKLTKDYLDHCVFSLKPVKSFSTTLLNRSQEKTSKWVCQLGGPADILLHPSDMIITHTTSKPYQYQSVINADPGQIIKFQLAHRVKIAGILHSNQFMITTRTLEFSGPLQWLTQLSSPVHSIDDSPISTYMVSIDDARFLLELIRPEEVIIPFIQQEIAFFLRERLKNPTAQHPHQTMDADETSDTVIKEHESYAQLSTPFIPKKPGFTRPRKHMVYGEIVAANNSGNLPLTNNKQQNDEMLVRLQRHVQRELVSFFGLDNIHIVLNKD